MLSLVLLDEDDFEKVERVDCEDEDDIDEETEEEVTPVEVIVPRSSKPSSNADTPGSSKRNTRHAIFSSNSQLDSMSNIARNTKSTEIGLGHATTTTTATPLRPGEKYLQENKQLWDNLLNFNKAKKSLYGTHGTKVNQLNVAGL